MSRSLSPHYSIGGPEPQAGGVIVRALENVQEVEVAADVDFEAVAQMCEGYSGDDMTNICRDAAMNGMRTLIAGKNPDQIRQGPLAPIHELHDHQPVYTSGSWHHLLAAFYGATASKEV